MMPEIVRKTLTPQNHTGSCTKRNLEFKSDLGPNAPCLAYRMSRQQVFAKGRRASDWGSAAERPNGIEDDEATIPTT